VWSACRGVVLGGRVIAVGLVIGAGFPREVPREGDGSFVLGPGLGLVVIEGREGTWVLGLSYARFLGPPPNPRLEDGVGGRLVGE
jgi:hypothetical protein